MRFASLGSGSRGNGTLVEYGGTRILVDCGFSVKETEKRLARLGCDLADIMAILVTHEHEDHCGGVAPCARKGNIPVYMTAGTYLAKGADPIPRLEVFDCHRDFYIGNIRITPVPVPHDSREPSQFVMTGGHFKLGVLTDVGSVTQHMVERYRDCDALLLESNHDVGMLARSAYPPSVKQRVASNWGHLSNNQAVEFLQKVEAQKLQHLVVAHISAQNNCLDIARRTMAEVTSRVNNVVYADQVSGFDWLTIE